jgi:magnesium chelatase family protein
MFVQTYSAMLSGIDADLISIEVDVSKGLPGFNIVGLAGKSINESRERIAVALQSCDFPLAPKRILVNLSPAHIKKEGAHLDLAISAALMANLGYINCDENFLENFCLFGELSLIGEIKSVSGILALSIEAQNKKIPYLIVSKENKQEISLINLDENKSKTEIFSVSNLKDLKKLIDLLYVLHISQNSQEQSKSSFEERNEIEQLVEEFRVKKLSAKAIIEFIKEDKEPSLEDVADVIGQEQAKRALEIAAAGNHHLLMIGPPGCGKSMLAKRFKNLLGNLDYSQALESTKIYSISGLLDNSIIFAAPFREPHHSATAVSLIGGGKPIRPGEISLAHNGVLFLDEMTEFSRFVIEQLRQIMDNGYVILNKANHIHKYPAKFLLIAACNPCPCGYLGDLEKSCSCTLGQISNYLARLSGPILDRIDIHIELNRLKNDEIKSLSSFTAEKNSYFSNAEISKRIEKSKEFFIEEKISEAPQSLINKEARSLLQDSTINLKLSARSHSKILKISRTIANLSLSREILEEHVAEALQFRAIDFQKYLRKFS